MTNFLINTDKDEISKLMEETTSNVAYFENLTNDVVTSYTKDMDILMDNIYKNIIQVEQPALNTLEKYFLELSDCLYYMGDKVERLGIYETMSKNAYKEVYNIKHHLPQIHIQFHFLLMLLTLQLWVSF